MATIPNFNDMNSALPPIQETTPVEYGEPKSASPLPLVLVSLAVALSIPIQVFKFELANNIWFLVGYGLTPVLTLIGMGWDSKAQLSGFRDPWFEAKPVYSTLIKILTVIGLVVGTLHIIDIGTWLGEQAAQAGWLA